jgi:hypothetical protein
MRLVTLADESSVSALADRLYANLTPASRQLAEAALLRDNPHLALAGALKPGVVVRVPVTPELTPKAGSPGRDPASDVLKDLPDAVSGYQKRLAESLSVAKKDLAEQSALLKSRDVKAAIAKSPDAVKLGASLANSLPQRTQAIADSERRLPGVFAQALKDIAALADQGD